MPQDQPVTQSLNPSGREQPGEEGSGRVFELSPRSSGVLPQPEGQGLPPFAKDRPSGQGLWIDSHCHLNYDYGPKSVDQVVQEAAEKGVRALVTIGTELSSIPDLERLSERYPQVFHTVGVHPHDVSAFQLSDLAVLEKAARHPKCRAIGEIGLDYHYDHSPREKQQAALSWQLDLAEKLQLPCVIHSREGEADLLMALRAHVGRLPSGMIPGVIHCFSGTLDFGKACLDLGFFIAFSGIVTFKKAEEVREAARSFPLDRLLVETDAPFLAPVPHRGKKCEPWMVTLNAACLAELKGVSLEELARVTTANAQRLFRIPG